MFCCPDGAKVDIFRELYKKSITHFYTEIKLTCSSCIRENQLFSQSYPFAVGQ